MKNYSSKTKAISVHKSRTYTTYKEIALGLVVFCALFFAKDILRTVSAFVMLPLYSAREYLASSSDTIPLYVRDRTALVERIETLENEIEAQQGIEGTLQYLESENNELRQLVGATSVPTVTAGVIARPPHTPYDTVIIDRGTDDGVPMNAPVYFGSGQALGYVRAVYGHYSLVTLFSSPNVETTVYVFGPDIFTTAYGEGGGVARLSIPHGVTVTVGDVVVLPSLEGGVFGTVQSIQSVPTEPEQRAYVTRATSLQSIRTVLVSTREQTPVSFEDAFRMTETMEESLFTVPLPEDTDASSTVDSNHATSSNAL